MCNTAKTLVVYILLYSISLFFICQLLVGWLYSSTISQAELPHFSKKQVLRLLRPTLLQAGYYCIYVFVKHSAVLSHISVYEHV